MSIDNNIDFKDHIVEYPNRFKQTTVAPGIVELVPTWIETPEQIIQPGTPVDSELFKKLKENVTCYSQTYIATEGQTVFSVTHPYNVGQSRIAVYIGGVKQRAILDFTESSSTSFVLNVGLPAGTKVEAVTISFVQPLASDVQQQIDSILQQYEANALQLDSLNKKVLNKVDMTYLDTLAASLASGAPKGVYASLSALQNAKPTGDTNIYLVSADGKWYYWSGTVWTAGGTYQATAIGDKSITPEKTSFLTLGDNLYNPLTKIISKVFTNGGSLVDTTSYDTTDFIPVKSGITYTAKSGVRYVALFNGDKTYQSMLVNALQNIPISFTATMDGFVRISVLKTTVDVFTVAQGTQPTELPYGYFPSTDFLLNNKIKKEDLREKIVSWNKTDFLEKGKNLFDLSKRAISYYFDSASSTYDTSEYIPVVAGVSYTVVKTRRAVLYDVNKVAVGGAIDNASLAPLTFTPTVNGYARVALFKADATSVQMEQGTNATSYEPFGVKMNSLVLNENVVGKNHLTADLRSKVNSIQSSVTMTKVGDLHTLVSKFDSTKDITIEAYKYGSDNGAFKMSRTFVGSDYIHSASDDIAPIRTFTTVGANHGYGTIIMVSTTHDKTVADLGSTWTDGTTVYTLLAITSNVLTLACPYTLVDGMATATAQNPTGTLTHVQNATHTNSIATSNLLPSPQLYPSINKVEVKAYVDGVEVTEDGTYSGSVIQFEEKYNVMDYKAIIDFARGNVGVSYANDNIEGIVQLTNSYTFTEGLKCTTSHGLEALKKVNLQNCGFMQSVAISLAGHTRKRFMPGVLPKGGFDFETGIDLDAYNTSLLFEVADNKVAGVAPSYYVDWLYASGVKKYGFAMGYIVDKTNTKHADRIALGGTMWDMRNTKKSYPVALKGTLEVGDYRQFMGFRNYLSSESVGVANVFTTVKDYKSTYLYFHTPQSSTVSKRIHDKIGCDINLIQSDGVIAKNDIVVGKGITLKTSGQANCIIKVN